MRILRIIAIDAVLIAFALVVAPGHVSTASLRDEADVSHRMIGTAVDVELLKSDAYANTLAREFNLAVPENVFMMNTIHPQAGVYNFVPGDKIVDFALRHNMKVHGHPLVWNPYTPAWVMKHNLNNVLHDHIQTVVKHYKGRVFEWIVVNEAFDTDGSMNWSVWYDTPGIGLKGQGTAYIEQSFKWAHEADPKARLVYNDVGAEEINAKSNAIYKMVKDFKQRGVHIDAVGFQMHLDLNGLDFKSVQANFDRFAALDVDIEITELDVAIPNHSWFGERRQAKVYKQVVQSCINASRCTELLTWGFTDRASWIPVFTRGMAGHALEFNADYQPKLAYTAMQQSFANPERRIN